MKLTKRQIRNIIREELQQVLLEKQDGSGPLGKYVMPKSKIDPDPGEDNEPYTSNEEKLEDALEKHFKHGKSPLVRMATDYILKLISDNNYPEIFKLYKGNKPLYRGMNLPRDVFKKLYGPVPKKAKWYSAPIDWWKERASKSGKGAAPFSTTTKSSYKPSEDRHAGSWASSWSDDLEAAMDFALKPPSMSNKDLDIAVVLMTDPSKHGVFIDTEPFYDNYHFAKIFEDEQEKIAVGNVAIDKVYVYAAKGEY